VKCFPVSPLRFLLADDPGAGKTIMAGLLIKELLIRGDRSARGIEDVARADLAIRGAKDKRLTYQTTGRQVTQE
jgi:hypothetical protein